jgi:DNA polymerase I-like protein with 3'-5' exonuclease and polymerase domains
MTKIVLPPRPPAPPPVGGTFSVCGPSLKEKAPACVVIDAETFPIELRPAYPPKPVGWAIQFPGERRGTYDAYGHPSKNNSTLEKAEVKLKRAWASGLPILCQHGKFDLDCAEVHHGLPVPPWERCLDTEYLLFLHDPHAKSLSLKPSAERLLGMRPEERDELRDWLIANVPEARKKPSEAMAWISKAPGDLVGRYAVGDLTRTLGLHKFLHPKIMERGMGAAYDRERRLMPILLETERVGIRTDMDALERDVPRFKAAREKVGAWLRKALHAPNLNLDSDQQVGEVLAREGVVTDWVWTKGGNGRAPQRSTSKKTMTLDKFHNRKIALAYGYYQRCGTLLSFFLEPWLELAGANGGWLKPNWNAVRSDRNGGLVGARSGRPSCDNPNFLAIVKVWENNKGDGYTHPKHIDVPELSLARRYLLPDENGLVLHRDYNQQELRTLASFENGGLAARYRARPYRDSKGSMKFDVHSSTQAGILELAAVELNRDLTKIVVFSDIYGKGIAGLAEEIKVDRKIATRVRDAKDALMPDVKALKEAIEAWGRAGQPIVTWGGRQYYAEPPGFNKKRGYVQDYFYKLLNYLVQPSAADITKEALIRYHDHPRRESRFLVTVYDEINASTPSLKGLSAKGKKDCAAREMAVLRECMETVEVSVPMLSDGKTGPSWGELSKFWNADEAREIV